MSDVVAILASWVLTTSAVFLVLRLDEGRMTPAQRDRAWPSTSRVAAAVVFGVLCLPIHFGRTRRGIAGVAIGIGVMCAVGLVASIPDLMLELEVIDTRTSSIVEAILATLVLFTLLYVRKSIKHRLPSVDPGGG
jgi:hypothetical protein